MFDIDSIRPTTWAIGGVGAACIIAALIKGGIEIHASNALLAEAGISIPEVLDPEPAATAEAEAKA